MSNETFFLVWNPATSYTMNRHYCIKQAETEAQRLAAKEPGKQFMVLQALTVFEKNDIKRTDLSKDSIPF